MIFFNQSEVVSVLTCICSEASLGSHAPNILSSLGRIGFNTVNPSLSTGKDYPVHSLNRMAVLHQNSGVIGKLPPLPSRFTSTLEMSRGRKVSGNLLGIGDGFPNISLVLMEHKYIAIAEIRLFCKSIEFRAKFNFAR